jgi:import receptor subunit TOM22
MDCRAFISSDPSVASRGSIGGSVEMAMDCSRINKGKPFRIRKFKWVIFDSLRFSNVSDDTHHNLCIMVLVEEVPEDVQLRDDEHESDFETDSNVSEVSAFSDDDDFSPADETIYDRIAALKDIVPPQTRVSISARYQNVTDWTWWGLQGAGTLAWWVSTSALLVGLPLALAIEDETRVVQQEREMQMQSAGQQQVRRLHRGDADV